MSTLPPFTHLFDLATLSEKGGEIALTPSEAERAAIAQWLDVVAVPALTATIALSRRGRDFYAYDAKFEADVVQACVVTLEPVPAHLSGSFRRSFRIVSSSASKRFELGPGGEISLSESEDPDVLEGTMVDLAEPLLEELSLSLDPYPRAPGVQFEAPDAAGEGNGAAKESPFAVLQALKDKTLPPAADQSTDKPKRRT